MTLVKIVMNIILTTKPILAIDMDYSRSIGD